LDVIQGTFDVGGVDLQEPVLNCKETVLVLLQYLVGALFEGFVRCALRREVLGKGLPLC
jgi:hypothetical protein